MQSSLISALDSVQRSYDGRNSFTRIFKHEAGSDAGALMFALEIAAMAKSLGITGKTIKTGGKSTIAEAVNAVFSAQNMYHNRTVVSANFALAMTIIENIIEAKYGKSDRYLEFYNGEISFPELFEEKKLKGTFSAGYDVIGFTGTRYSGTSGDLLSLKSAEIEDMVLGIKELKDERFLALAKFVEENPEILKERFKNSRMVNMMLVKFHAEPEMKNNLVEFMNETLGIKKEEPKLEDAFVEPPIDNGAAGAEKPLEEQFEQGKTVGEKHTNE